MLNHSCLCASVIHQNLMSESHVIKWDNEKRLERELGKCWKVEGTDPLVPLQRMVYG